MSICIRPITATEARRFVNEHHRHNEAPSSTQVSFAVRDARVTAAADPRKLADTVRGRITADALALGLSADDTLADLDALLSLAEQYRTEADQDFERAESAEAALRAAQARADELEKALREIADLSSQDVPFTATGGVAGAMRKIARDVLAASTGPEGAADERHG